MLRLTLITLAYVFMSTVSAFAQDWGGITALVSPGVFRLESSVDGELYGICSAGLINDKDDFVLTAAHCVPPKQDSVTVGNKHAEVEKVNYLLDLAVLKVPGIKGKELALRASDLTVGTPIAIAGYAWGTRSIKYTFGHISDMAEESLPLSLLIDAVVISGHSGGVAVDRDGHLVGTVQAALIGGALDQSEHLAISANAETVRDFAHDYFPPAPKVARK